MSCFRVNKTHSPLFSSPHNFSLNLPSRPSEENAEKVLGELTTSEYLLVRLTTSATFAIPLVPLSSRSLPSSSHHANIPSLGSSTSFSTLVSLSLSSCEFRRTHSCSSAFSTSLLAEKNAMLGERTKPRRENLLLNPSHVRIQTRASWPLRL